MVQWNPTNNNKTSKMRNAAQNKIIINADVCGPTWCWPSFKSLMTVQLRSFKQYEFIGVIKNKLHCWWHTVISDDLDSNCVLLTTIRLQRQTNKNYNVFSFNWDFIWDFSLSRWSGHLSYLINTVRLGPKCKVLGILTFTKVTILRVNFLLFKIKFHFKNFTDYPTLSYSMPGRWKIVTFLYWIDGIYDLISPFCSVTILTNTIIILRRRILLEYYI